MRVSGLVLLAFCLMATATPVMAAEQEAFRPVWVSGGDLSRRGEEAVKALSEFAEAQGLPASRYDTDSIASALGALKTERSEAAQEKLEAAINQGVARLVNDLAHGTRTRTSDDALIEQAMRTDRLDTFLASLLPQTPDYKALTQALTRYRAIAAEGGWPKLAAGKPIKPGMTDPRLAEVRAILVKTGDLEASKATAEGWDEALEQAIKTFQERHGLTPDGALGARTQEAMRVPAEKRVGQILATLDRMREAHDTAAARYVRVNIPAYRLTAYEGGKEALAMKVIIGAPHNPTPVFERQITHIILNPAWGVPQRIAAQEMLPKIRDNMDYLSNGGYRLTDRHGNQVDPEDVDWSEYGRGNFPYSIRQNPGRGNALGKVKFQIADSDGIYLHDTASPKLFAKDDRALSHGCVRVEQPQMLAHFILGNHGDWTDQSFDKAYGASAQRQISVEHLPVQIVYWTAEAGEDGKVRFYRDIYNRDARVLEALNAIKPSSRLAGGGSEKQVAGN